MASSKNILGIDVIDTSLDITASPIIPTPPVIGTGPDSLILAISEDAYLGDAQFTVSINGVRVGGVFLAQALHAKGQHQDFVFRGTWAPNVVNTVSVNFLNDAWGGTAALDRNLYIDSLTIDGAVTPLGTEEYVAGPQTFSFGSAATSATFIDSRNQHYSTAIVPLAQRPLQDWVTGLNNNIYEWVEAGGVTGIGASSFDMIQTISLVDGSGASFSVYNFDEADVSLSGATTAAGHASVLRIGNAMRGSITLGDGNYDTSINVLSAYANSRQNTFHVSLGTGTDTLVLTGDASRTYAMVTAGSGTATLSFVDVLDTFVVGGTGQATLNLGAGRSTVVAGSGQVDVHAGSGADTYVFHAGAGLMTIDSFNPMKGDVLQIDAALQSTLIQTQTAAGTMLAFGTSTHGILLKGIPSVPANLVTYA